MEGTATPLKRPPHLTAWDQVSTHRPVSPLTAPWRSAGYEGTLWTVSQESCPPGQRWNLSLTGVTGRLEEVSGPGSPRAEMDSPYVPVSSFPDLCCFRFSGRAPDGRREPGASQSGGAGAGGAGGLWGCSFWLEKRVLWSWGSQQTSSFQTDILPNSGIKEGSRKGLISFSPLSKSPLAARNSSFDTVDD